MYKPEIFVMFHSAEELSSFMRKKYGPDLAKNMLKTELGAIESWKSKNPPQAHVMHDELKANPNQTLNDQPDTDISEYESMIVKAIELL